VGDYLQMNGNAAFHCESKYSKAYELRASCAGKFSCDHIAKKNQWNHNFKNYDYYEKSILNRTVGRSSPGQGRTVQRNRSVRGMSGSVGHFQRCHIVLSIGRLHRRYASGAWHESPSSTPFSSKLMSVSEFTSCILFTRIAMLMTLQTLKG